MIYTDVCGDRLSLLGFGTMRLPCVSGPEDIDQAQVDAMVDYAMAHGVNYFDTAAPYHGGKSEIAIGKALARYPRESYRLADKYPGHQYLEPMDPGEIFFDQLKKCGVEYFDYYLLHNVNENSIGAYLNEEYGIVPFLLEQKRLGRIRHLGFSCHGFPENLEAFLDRYGDVLEFCQIQLNYLDWSLQDAERKYAILSERGVPVWVMEPVHGGMLVNLPEAQREKLRAVHPDKSIASWGFRWLQGLENVHMVLSGMSNLEQMEDNVKTFDQRCPLDEAETALVYEVAEALKQNLPCTGCRYCCDGCPLGLNIPWIIANYNEYRVSSSINITMRMDSLPAEKRPEACIGCGQCAKACPQKIDVPKAMKEFGDALKNAPSWADIVAERNAAEKRNRT